MCYQLPAVAQSGIAFVISPLIALMQDQVVALRAKKINAAVWNSSEKVSEIKKIQEDLNQTVPKLKLLYVTPELMQTEKFQEIARNLYTRKLISLIAIDEAHCISTWVMISCIYYIWL